MKTTKHCSTISYNSKEFLQVKLNELIIKRTIDFWAFIEHLPEEDEKKSHIHLFIVPNGKVDTDQIKDYLTELNPSDIAHPFGCIFFQSSKFADWFFYSLHDTEYLSTKGQSRKYRYTEEELFLSDIDYFTALKHEIDYSKYGNKKTKIVINAIESGTPLTDLLNAGLISPQNFLQWEKIHNHITYRNDRQTHTPFTDETIDLETGEVEYDPETVIAFEAAAANKRKS